MPRINKIAGIKGVRIGYYKGRPRYWVCQIKRKQLTFLKTFPFTDEGKKLAGELYIKKLIEINAY